jgi:hypothetical protein
VVLLDERLGVARSQLGDDQPVVAPFHKLLVGVLDADDWDPLPPRLLDEAAEAGDDGIALVSPPPTTPFCTSTTRSAVCGRFSSVVIVASCSRGAQLSTRGETYPPPPPCHLVEFGNVLRGSPRFAPGTICHPRI